MFRGPTEYLNLSSNANNISGDPRAPEMLLDNTIFSIHDFIYDITIDMIYNMIYDMINDNVCDIIYDMIYYDVQRLGWCIKLVF